MSGSTSVPVLPGQVFIMKGLRGAAVVLRPVCISAWIGLLQLSGHGYSPAPSWGCDSFGEGLLFEASRVR